MGEGSDQCSLRIASDNCTHKLISIMLLNLQHPVLLRCISRMLCASVAQCAQHIIWIVAGKTTSAHTTHSFHSSCKTYSRSGTTMGCTLFQRPYCGQHLLWWILQDGCRPDQAPDIVFQDDPSFSPLTACDSSSQQQLDQMLRSWGSSSRLEELIGLLLVLYAQHNKARIAAAVTDERILFELSMLDELGCTEVLLTGADSSGPQQARFALPVPVDLSAAQQLLACMRKLEQNTAAAQARGANQQHLQMPSDQPQQQHDQQQQFVLTVSFLVSQGSSSHIPALHLQSPSWFTNQLPAMTLPVWDPHASLLEYVPHLAERIDKHLADFCPSAANRVLLFEGLSRLLGPALEVNMSLLHSSSASSGATLASAGSRTRVAAGWAAGMWQVLFDQQPLLLFVELPRSYPAEGPVLSLQNLRHTGSDSFVTLQDLPWSPRWPVDEQVARLFNFLKVQAAKASVLDTAVIGGAGAGSSRAAGSSNTTSPVAAAAAGPGPSTSALPTSPGFYL